MKQKYGVFVYDKQTDANIDCNHYSSKGIALAIAKSLKINKDSYVEVWKQSKNGMWGDTGSPIWKSDNKKKRAK